ncbi:MAG TPA: PAS domain S-box protein [Thermoanaerobaculia bacterium]|nr:PAS domain S-box protein [Thermoanaerobaculia bacterium]
MLERSPLPAGPRLDDDVLEALPLGVLVVGADLSIRHANRAACGLIGLTCDEVAGMRWTDLFPDASHGGGFPLPARHLIGYRRPPSGSLVWLEVESASAPAGSPHHAVCTLRDVTELQAEGGEQAGWKERLRVEEQLLQARSEWTATVDTVTDMILLEDANGRVLRCNRAATLFFRATFTEILGRPLNDLFFPDRRPGEVHPWFRRESAVVQFPVSDRWYEVTNYPLAVRIARGGAGWVHVIKDVTERREAEVLARRLTAAIDQAAESVVILGPAARVEYVNPAFLALSGLTEGEALGRRLRSLGIGPAERRTWCEIVRTLARGQVWLGAYTARDRHGATYQEEATVSPVRDADGRLLHYVAVCRDVTERRRLESIAEAVNMMDNVGTIFSSLRHELGNPINSIKTALSVLRKNLDQYPPETVESYLDRTLAEIGRVEYLLKALRSFNMHEKPRIERVDMARFVADFCALVRQDFEERGIRVEPEIAGDPGPALADPRALHQVLLNLLTNAADALEGREAPRIVLRLEKRGWSVDLTVADNGAGIPESRRADLFRPFHTGKPHGTGLGLAIVKKLVTQMGGTVEVESETGVGTEVRVSLAAAGEGALAPDR